MHIHARHLVFTAALAALAAAAPASAMDYNFNVQYDGNNSAHLQPGSDTFSALLAPGDSFTYTLTAQDNWLWRVNAAADYFALFALGASEQAIRIGDVSLTLALAGVTTDSYSEDGVQTSYVHVGTNTVPLPLDLKFDSLTLHYTLHSADAVDSNHEPIGQPSNTTLNGPLLIFGAPEYHYSGGVDYISAVPEPGAWALMLGGLLAVGRLAQRRASTQA